MSRKHGGRITNSVRKPNTEEAAMMMSVARQYCAKQNGLMERTAEVVTFLTGYMLQKMESLDANLDANTPFSQRLKNRTNHVAKSCEEFLEVMEPYIEGDQKKTAYMEVSDLIFPLLDNLFDDLHREDNQPSLKLTRRAKLRYHDPYKAMVAERQESFEDGYCKGYKDCVADIHRELAQLKDAGDPMAVIDIIDGSVSIRRVEPQN